MTRLILASSSAARRTLLAAAGVVFEVVAPDVDEAAVKARETASRASPRDIARTLARAKALDVARRLTCREEDPPASLVIGADQTLEFDAALFGKPANLEAARAMLHRLSGQTHALHSALAVVRDGALVWSHCQSVALTLRELSADFIEAYLRRGGEGLLRSPGAYLLEGEGIQLFERIDGDYFAVLGLPLLPLLDFLRQKGALAS